MAMQDMAKKKKQLGAMAMPPKKGMEVEMDFPDDKEGSPEEGSPEEEAMESPEEEKAEDSELGHLSDDELLAEVKKRGLSKQLEDGEEGQEPDEGDMSHAGQGDDDYTLRA